MFEDAMFHRAELYFTMLQLLRISGEWVGETSKDLERFLKGAEAKIKKVNYYQRGGDGEEKDQIRVFTLFENLKEESMERFQPLKDRIQSRTKEIESLRDGVSTFLWRITRSDALHGVGKPLRFSLLQYRD